MDRMKKLRKFNFVLFLLPGWLIFVALFIVENLDAARPDKGMSEQVKVSEQRLAQLNKTTEKLKALVDEPITKKTTASEQKEVNAYSKWLKNAIDQFNNLSSRWETYLRNKNLSPPKKEMKYDPQVAEDLKVLNLQYLLLRNKIYQENSDFKISSNALKKKRETVRELILKLK
jgi:hypothetical protein